MILFFAISSFLQISCSKDHYGIPEVTFNKDFSLLDPRYRGLAVSGGYALSDDGGVAGIVVYNNGGSFVAFDRCSTVNPENRCAVDVGNGGLSLIDACSGGVFDITNGMPSRAPAERPLKPYQVRRMGDIISVLN